MTLPKKLGKRKCKCGRKIIVARTDEGRIPRDEMSCSTCKTYGLEESKRLFVQENAMLRKKSERTKFEITEGTLHVNSWKKK